MRKKLFYIGLFFLTIINLAAFGTLTYNKYCHYKATCPMNKSKPLRGQALCQKLQLSDTQIKQMRDLSHNFHSQVDSLADVLKEKRLELLELLREDHASKEQMRTYVDHINTLQKELQFEVIKYLLSQKEILHKDQQQIFIQLIEQRLKKETIHFKSTGFDFIEGSCAHNCENSNQCDSLKNN